MPTFEIYVSQQYGMKIALKSREELIKIFYKLLENFYKQKINCEQ
jgi:hypothetical protein